MKLNLRYFCLALGVGAAFSAKASLVNPGFETGNTTGWTPALDGGADAVVTTHTAYDGVFTYAAPDGNNFLTLTGGAANDVVTLSQTFSLNAGDAITVWAAIDMRDVKTHDQQADVLWNGVVVWHKDQFSSDLSTPEPGHTSWQSLVLTAASTGLYTLAFDVYQGTTPSGGYQSVAGLFDVAVPEPSTLLAGGLMALVTLLGFASPKRRRAA